MNRRSLLSRALCVLSLGLLPRKKAALPGVDRERLTSSEWRGLTYLGVPVPYEENLDVWPPRLEDFPDEKVFYPFAEMLSAERRAAER